MIADDSYNPALTSAPPDTLSALTRSVAWKALLAHRDTLAPRTLADLFAADGARAGKFCIEAGPLFLDHSRQPVADETLTLLRAWLVQSDFTTWREKLFNGERINTSEDRAASHTLLRSDDDANIRNAREAMLGFATRVRDGEFLLDGQPVSDVVHIGIGGSDLGPRLVCEALGENESPRLHFVSNLDPSDVADTLRPLNAATTLVIVSSKTFTTAETLANAKSARAWLAQTVGQDKASQHFCAVTASVARAREWGIAEERIFAYQDSVGGRFSLWSSVGLPIAIALGSDAFRQLLQGAAQMDQHFRTAPTEQNLPVTAALLDAWQRNFRGAATRAVFPYAHRLTQLTPYLQQLEMESLGKTVDRDGQPVDYATAPVVWGGTGTIAQHSVFQWLQQGSDTASVEFIAVGSTAGSRLPVSASVLAQADALAFGRPDSNTFRACAGNRGSSLIVLAGLTPTSLGALLAFYEHKVFTLAVLWNLNPFDQWGVELGKTLTRDRADTLGKGEMATPAARRLMGQ